MKLQHSWLQTYIKYKFFALPTNLNTTLMQSHYLERGDYIIQTFLSQDYLLVTCKHQRTDYTWIRHAQVQVHNKENRNQLKSIDIAWFSSCTKAKGMCSLTAFSNIYQHFLLALLLLLQLLYFHFWCSVKTVSHSGSRLRYHNITTRFTWLVAWVVLVQVAPCDWNRLDSCLFFNFGQWPSGVSLKRAWKM